MGAIRGILVLHFTSDSPFILAIDWYILPLPAGFAAVGALRTRDWDSHAGLSQGVMNLTLSNDE